MNIKSAEFCNLSDAAQFRKQHGGWLAVLGATNVWWFDAASYTPSSIMQSRQCKGRSFELICDNRFEDGVL